MFRWFAGRALDAFSKRYEYDVSYLRAILAASPRALALLNDVAKAARHREAAATNAFFAAKLVGVLVEDCGPCTQLVVNMAREAGVRDDQIEAVLKRDEPAMDADIALGFQFAEAVAYRLAHEEELREAVRARWGEKGVVDLTYGLQIGRLFPMIKAGLGFAMTCQRVKIGARGVDVAKRAA